jgi:hypothetical protein
MPCFLDAVVTPSFAASSSTTAFCEGVYVFATRDEGVRVAVSRGVGVTGVGGVFLRAAATVNPSRERARSQPLTEVCGTPYFLAVAETPIVGTSASTASRCSFV